MTTFYTHMDSPIGPLLLTSDGTSLTGLYMAEHRHGPTIGAGWVRDASAAPFAEAGRQLVEYFCGQRTDFDLPLAPAGTPFQQRVWAELARIPYGETISYVELARRVGSPNASRAAGQANGRNPVSIVVPCHRVVAADGSLGGYGGGLDRKRALIDLETATKARHR